MSKDDKNSAPVIRFAAARSGRADALVADKLETISRRQLRELFADGQVRIDGRVARKGEEIKQGQQVELMRLPLSRTPVAVELAIEVVFEDTDLIAVAKPAGLASHPIRSGERDTVANWLAHHHPEAVSVGDDEREAGLCHRLDRGTSGVLIAARNRETWRSMREMFGSGIIRKRYLAVVAGTADSGHITRALRRQGKRTIAADSEDGDEPPTTRWRVSAHGPDVSLLEVELVGGRMHQIRAHLALVGHPIIGDELYGYAGPAITVGGPLLHAHSLEFRHPRTDKDLVITAALPRDRAELLQSLGLAKPDASSK